jgi:tRNA pseudouridine55 synthase
MIEGILPLWKEKGMTSFDCVYKVRKILGIKKMGHSGTLDPEVDGVLPIAIGSATKVLEYMLDADKVYKGELTIGYSTSTEDATGEMIEQAPVNEEITEKAVDETLQSFVGKIKQVPPMYSAVKVKGKRLYEYAFEGIEVERPSRVVEIYSIKRTSDIHYNPEEKTVRFSFETACSKGTYIRTLAVEIAKKLGYPGHMSQLTRIKSGEVSAEQTVTLRELEEIAADETLNNVLLSIDYALTDFPRIDISEDLWKRVKNGALLNGNELDTPEFPVLLRHKETIVALYDKHPTKDGLLKPKKMFKIEL